MCVITQRIWSMPNGEQWMTWVVTWIEEDGRVGRKPFDRYDEAESFLTALTHLKSWERQPAYETFPTVDVAQAPLLFNEPAAQVGIAP